jgi:cytochrome c oxidase subunit 3
MSSEAKTHPHHMVKLSPWPIVGSLGAFSMATGGIWLWLFLVGLAIVMFCMFRLHSDD